MDATRISALALVITGEQDVLKPAAAIKQLAETLPNATYLELPGTGHYSFSLGA